MIWPAIETGIYGLNVWLSAMFYKVCSIDTTSLYGFEPKQKIQFVLCQNIEIALKELRNFRNILH